MSVRMTLGRATLAQVAQGLTDAVALSVAISSIAFAGPRQPPPFDALDRNADERLSRSEASYDRTLAEIFASSDLNGDGFVDRDEYARAIRNTFT